MRIAYVLSAFPSTSETFILHQIVGAVQADHQVDIHAYKVSGHVKHPALAANQLLNHVYYRPTVPTTIWLRLLKTSSLMLALLLLDTRRCFGLLGLWKATRFSEWLELFFLAWPLRGGKKYDVIHAHFGSNGLMAVRLRQAGFLQGNIVTSFHGFDANVVPNMLGKDYYRVLFEHGDAFVVSSKFIGHKLSQLACPKHKIRRIPVGIDVNDWSFQQRSGWQGDAPMVLSVGRLTEVKGFTYAVTAMAKVRHVFADVQYQIVGDGDLKESLLAQAKALHLDDCIHFLGKNNQAELDTLYQQSDLFIMPSIRAHDGAEEGQGMVLFEAQASGLAVIATDTGGIIESLSVGSSLISEKDSDALAAKIITQLQTLKTQGYDGHHGRDFVKENFDIDKLNQQTLLFYRELI